ncbi:unnamed protein product [Heligmosomoides polygyrus]|uniref:MFS domain-containing protein n=1 Tax=Heligmosomoides polygyrus TaxID=6339 RepID=A0A3P8ADR8_HELPZ|nr:unnamed protein product [Heligmosomoides polygyrus]
MKVVVAAEQHMYHFFSAYAPQTAKDEFWTLLDEKTAEVQDGYSCRGGFGYGASNADGERILEYADSHNLTIANTMFRKRDSHLVSFYSGNTNTQIDFILVRHRDRRLVTDAKVVPYETLATQHRPLICTLMIAPPRLRQVERCGPARIKWWRMKEKDAAAVCCSYSVADAARSELGMTKPGRRKIEKQTWLWTDDVKKKVKEKKSEDIEKFFGINDDNGHLLMNRKRAMERWHDYFERISTVEFSYPPIPCVPPTHGPVQKITVEEMDAALTKMKQGKATGPDDIAAELWNSRCWNPAEWLTKFLNQVVTEKKVPGSWQQSTTIPIWKKMGSPADCTSYRPIRLLTSYRPIRIVDERIREIVRLSANQCGGFMFGYQLLITNPAQDAFMAFLNSSYQEIHGETKDSEFIGYLWGVIVSSFFWGATAGSLLIGMIADWVGRKNGLIFTYIVQILAVIMEIISFFTNSYIMYTVSRILLGVAISISIGIGPMFVIECSPVSCRGIISMSTGVLLQCGLVVGSIVAMPEIWGTSNLWYLVYLLELVLTAGVLIIFYWAPESPSYTATKLNDDKRAERAVVYYHGISAEEAVSVVEGMKKSSVKGETPLGLFEIFAVRDEFISRLRVAL